MQRFKTERANVGTISSTDLAEALSLLENAIKNDRKKYGPRWTILKRWNVPWSWKEFTVASIAFLLSLSFPWMLGIYCDFRIGEGLSVDAAAGLYLTCYTMEAAFKLGVLYYFVKSYRPLSSDLFVFDIRQPFAKQSGWLLSAGWTLLWLPVAILWVSIQQIFLNATMASLWQTVAMPHVSWIRESTFSGACLFGLVGVVAPISEEIFFRGFMMASLTKWVPTHVALLIIAAVFALIHLNPAGLPQLFVCGIAYGFSYARSRNLLTPILVHSLWNSVVFCMHVVYLRVYLIPERS